MSVIDSHTPLDEVVPSGRYFRSSVYREAIRLLLPETVGAAFALADFAFDTSVEKTLTNVRTAAGVVEMGPGDALECIPLGTAAAGNTYTLYVTRLDPVVAANGTLGGFTERQVAALTITLNAATVSAVMDTISGVDGTDLVASTIAAVASGIAVETNTNGRSDTYVFTGSARSWFIAPARGAQFLRLKATMGTATTALVIGRRMKGEALPYR